ncbi:MAG: immunity 17 family protein [Neisseriaceae bacterium]|nr:immunity 17 family protein [Neisseriaceae bacterium]MBR6876761.1 immunity 17 family protein [Neisseriaceae bacterium]
MDSILIILAGVMCIASAIFNWNWFYTNARASLFVYLLGRNGARIFYALLGIFLIWVAIRLS